jgi:hypothetical protein
MVRTFCVTLAIAAAIGGALVSGQSAGQDRAQSFVATGTVKTVSSSALTLEMKRGEMTFAVKPSTRLVGKGKAGDLLWRERGPRLTDIVEAGDRVTVTYRQSGDIPTAVQVRVVQRSER